MFHFTLVKLYECNEKLVICDENPRRVKKELDKWGIVPHYPLTARTLDVSLFLDTKRKGTLESYFD